MVVIAGIVDFDGYADDDRIWSILMDAPSQGSRSASHTCNPFANFATQSAEALLSTGLGSAEPRLVAADIRLDNRAEIVAQLGLSDQAETTKSDTYIFARAWDRWGPGALERLIGDFAVAVWEEGAQRLTLARSPLAIKTLFYARRGNRGWFASLPQPIRRAGGSRSGIDVDAAVLMTAGDAFATETTLFPGIYRVPQGHAVQISRLGLRKWRIWDFDERPPPHSLEEAGEQLRTTLSRAVADRLPNGPVAAQLSGGRDSSAVVATAAGLLAPRGGQLLALTHAPRLGFDDGTDREWLSDESAIAAQTARSYPNIIHRVLRPEPPAVETLFDDAHRSNYVPLLNASNADWALRTVREADDFGASVLLTGTMGNFSISRGGVDAIIDVRRQGVLAWARLARELHQQGLPLRTLLNQGFGHLLAPRFHDMARRLAGRRPKVDFSMPFLRQPFRTKVEQAARAAFADQRPRRHYRQQVREHLYSVETGVTVGLERGIEICDPTSDIRLIRFCDSLEPAQLVSGRSPRPAYQQAFAGIVPDEVVAGCRRGFQGADWFETFPADQLRNAFRRYHRHPVVAEWIDLVEVERMLDRWPREGGWRMETIILFGQRLLNTLAIASFITVNFND